MGEFGIERLEELVREEIAAEPHAGPTDALADRWRAMARRPQTSGSRWMRTLRWLEHKARRVLHEIRKRRSG